MAVEINDHGSVYLLITHLSMHGHYCWGGGAGGIHVISDLPNIFNVNCDLHIFST